jgi:hypothetical protein
LGFFGEERDAQRLTTVNILLVGKHKQDDIAHFAVLDDAAEFGFGFFHARAVAGVDDEDEGVGSWRRAKILVFRGLWFACSFARNFDMRSSFPLLSLASCMYVTHQRSSVSKEA